MFERFPTRRIVLAGASLALLGGGIALPATAMAAPTTAPQTITLPQDSADGIGTGGDANAENTTVGGTATGGNASTGVGSCKGKCVITTGNATGGNASADAVNTGDATAVGGDGTGTGGKVNKQNIKAQVKKDLKAKLGK
ncbi:MULTISPECIES: hypothetical protein [unclassified Streptomyces]|uniref:hypothetical protein n=1 Tax=unclassified Streptomyces TaxID=2593676 RepID=UPI002257CD82|nr:MULTISPECIES: hypothetical protein [unclassified Streptomyces]WSW57672.1 hypothetical protein OG513_03310 [Streptomyces sp. NBC_00998]MCX5149769.1 hypothetical protein [Streptomyces sp. NBC_00320]MCX5149786.1 hypothetical protein [Streptomyces sp. NBC_00320]WSN52803.1 hypothetical protein OG299_36520 [Streptomyces sp. NBC_01296]WSN52820.1 hypothetical protein OG299_36605 [Streptomyces sp. NBC_01296]